MPASTTSARSPRRMRRARAALASLACALLLGTVACSSPEGDETPASDAASTATATATDEPIFASDEEALAAAVEAYESYTEMSWQIVSEGGAQPDRIRSLVSDRLSEQFVDEFEALSEAGIRSSGSARIYGARLAERVSDGPIEQLSAYICQDVSAVRLLDGSGTDVTPPDRAHISAVLVSFKSEEPGSPQLILEDVEKWDEDSFCA